MKKNIVRFDEYANFIGGGEKKRNDLKFTKKDLETFEREIRTYTYTYKRREHKYEHRYRQETRYTRNI